MSEASSDDLLRPSAAHRTSSERQIRDKREITGNSDDTLKASKARFGRLRRTFAEPVHARRCRAHGLQGTAVRIRSVQSTQKITKAMQMVAAAKLRRAQDGGSRAPYAEHGRRDRRTSAGVGGTVKGRRPAGRHRHDRSIW